MPIELIVPSMGESITEVQIGSWLRAAGDTVSLDDPVVVLESDKASLELPAPATGTVTQVLKGEGDMAEVGEIIGYLEEGEGAAKPGGDAAAASTSTGPAAAAPAAPAPAAAAPAPAAPAPAAAAPAGQTGAEVIMPAAQRLIAEHGLDASKIPATGPGGRLLKEDVERFVNAAKPAAAAGEIASPSGGGREEEVVRMTPIRRTIAKRLVEAQQTAALLTTFNEIDMAPVMALRKEMKDAFIDKHGAKLGFMSFFVKSVVEALKDQPAINAEVREDSVVYKNYYDIGVAVGGPRGLVVPVIRNAERLSFAGIEKAIADFGARARENTIKLEELQGGTFTISNGGVYGSLMSTPIVNPPQSGVLGMHSIQQRPVAIDGQVVIRPMMYVALTYDHRVVDGKEAVTFLKRIKELIENPSRMLLEV